MRVFLSILRQTRFSHFISKFEQLCEVVPHLFCTGSADGSADCGSSSRGGNSNSRIGRQPRLYEEQRGLCILVPQSTDTQSLAQDTPSCARSTLNIMVQVR